MKKLAITLATIITGVAVHAATYSWAVSSGWVSPDDDSALEGASVYAFDASAYSSSMIMAALSSTGSSVLSDALNFSSINEDGEFKVTGESLFLLKSLNAIRRSLYSSGLTSKT